MLIKKKKVTFDLQDDIFHKVPVFHFISGTLHMLAWLN